MPGQTSRRSALCVLAGPFISIFSSSTAHARTQLTISTVSAPDDPGIQLPTSLQRRAFADLGYDLVFAQFPGERGLVEADSGRIDGDSGRLPVLLKGYPNLVAVPESTNIARNSAYAISPIAISSVDDIVAGKLRVVTLIGLKWAEANIQHRISGDLWHAVRTYRQALDMLVLGRADVLVATESTAKSALDLHEYRTVRKLAVLAEVETFMVLNRKWAQLAQEVAPIIRKYKGR